MMQTGVDSNGSVIVVPVVAIGSNIDKLLNIEASLSSSVAVSQNRDGNPFSEKIEMIDSSSNAIGRRRIVL